MQKLSYFLFISLFVVTNSLGQDPVQAVKMASKALSAYNLNPTDNGAKLEEAIELIEIAIADEKVAERFKTWNTCGDIYFEKTQQLIMRLVDNPNTEIQNPTSGIKAANSYKKALELASKKYEIKDAVTGLSQACKNLNYIGNALVQSNKYGHAYDAFILVLNNNDIVIEKGGEAPIPFEEVKNQKYVAAVCADSSGKTAEAKALYAELYNDEYREPSVYAKYFNILNKEGNSAEALKVLEKGRALFPDDIEVLFTEINYYIQTGQNDVLEEKLKAAIAKEPNNPAIYSALGDVYQKFFIEEFKEKGDSENSKTYFAEALKYFEKTIELNPNAVAAIYGIGSLNFNKAKELVKVQDKLSVNEVKKYEEMKVEIDALFDKSLPYFKKAESLDPNDMNTLTALFEIFERSQDYEKSNEFKARLEHVKAGGQNESSYFNL